MAIKNQRFAITDTKLYVPLVTLLAQDNEKLLTIAAIKNKF